MKKPLLFLVVLALALGLCACSPSEPPENADRATTRPVAATTAASQEIENSDSTWTLMVYMCGSDLESGQGSATGDLSEMIESGFDTDNINVVVQAGGSNQWQNELCDPEYSTRLTFGDGGIEVISQDEIQNMGDPDTLRDFVNWAVESYAADNYALIFWDHGGGPSGGACNDELFAYDALTLSEMNQALSQTPAAETPFELIGFDTCLMGNLEVASLMSDYTQYYVGSQELEPGYGWDYRFLSDLSQDTGMDGGQLGSVIVDRFQDFYVGELADSTTLSVVDCGKIGDLVDAFNRLIAAVGGEPDGGFATVARARSGAKSFGSPDKDGESLEIIDLGHFAERLSGSLPEESQAVLDALREAVVYSRHNEELVSNANGLTIFLPYANKQQMDVNLQKYNDYEFSEEYKQFIDRFVGTLGGENLASFDLGETVYDDGAFSITLAPEEIDNIAEIYLSIWCRLEEDSPHYYMTGEVGGVEVNADGTILTEFDGKWFFLDGHMLSLSVMDTTESGTVYYTFAKVNGQDVIMYFLHDGTGMNILGTRPDDQDAVAPPKTNMTPVRTGDTIQFYYDSDVFSEDPDELESTDPLGTLSGEEFILTTVEVEYGEVPSGEYVYGFWIVDLQGYDYYTDFLTVD